MRFTYDANECYIWIEYDTLILKVGMLLSYLINKLIGKITCILACFV